MQHRNARILIFAKAPHPGQVKTRLIPPLSPQAAAALYARLLEQTLETAARRALAPLQIHCANDLEHPLFKRLAARFNATLHPQHGADLGARLHHGLRRALEGADSALAIGGDIPSLQTADLEQALQALRAGSGAVLGPAEDGGYYLLGLRRPQAGLFQGIHWGGDQVLAQTRQRLAAAGLQWVELTERWDLDRPADLQRYQAQGLDLR